MKPRSISLSLSLAWNTIPSFPFLLFSFILYGLLLAPQRNRNGNERQQQQQAAQISQATDGSTILDATANMKNKKSGVQLRFKVSGPADQFTTRADVPGATQQPGAAGNLGVNVLLHGDGGQSFFDFPNQAVQGNLMGVVILAPSEQLLWGQRTGQPQGLTRDDGAADAQTVADFVSQILPQVVAFDPSQIFFTGVSGGSLLLSGFFVPAQLANFAGGGGAGVLLMCGALEPQVDVVNASSFIGNTKIHFQSTQDELASLQGAIPDAIRAYEALAADQGLGAREIGQLQTVDNTPSGGHCEFDEQGFVSGIQLVADNFANIMQGGDGAVQGINADTVLVSVVGNEDVFGA
ncbi:hypothetical protein B0H66DRAFT_572522 [Apodospora peruviana]|uniref:Uncharacterized protein n=1 Tax=Apodospora peruviana TaxID=516989 RepID=A0AAE0ISH0_9PEZI|nr:hypothetical protein B0H66DRAFT_572522 [Apodospora peruviana]